MTLERAAAGADALPAAGADPPPAAGSTDVFCTCPRCVMVLLCRSFATFIRCTADMLQVSPGGVCPDRRGGGGAESREQPGAAGRRDREEEAPVGAFLPEEESRWRSFSAGGDDANRELAASTPS